jgi:Cd2+/Zn2+-exporting ATPase
MSSGTRAAACQVCELHAESVFRIEGMDCHEEVAILERRLGRLSGLEDLSADVIGQRLRIKYDAARLSTSTILSAVADTGMRAWLEHEEPTGTPSHVRYRQLLAIAAGVLTAAGLGLEHLSPLSALSAGSVALYVGAIVAGGAFTARRAVASARALSLDINVLMLVAVTGAAMIGQWSEAATVTFLFGLAQALEARSMDRARRALRALMDLAPAEALIRRDGQEILAPIESIRVGDTMIVRPGEKIALDGMVVAGESEVNQAPITGESLPVEKHQDTEVFAGTINGRGALQVRVTRLLPDSTLARIIALVEHAQAERSPSQAFVERFARVYTPVVLVLAVVAAVVPPLLFHASFGEWFYRALVLLVISCPCALVISTPVCIVSALAAAARKGVLIKGGLYLERTGSVQCVAFDKTGTLTKGRPRVLDVISLDGGSPQEVLRIAAALESRSEHPIGEAIVRRARETGALPAPADAFRSLPGRGAEGLVAGQPVLVGNHRLFEERGICTPDVHARLAAFSGAGRTAVLVGSAGKTVGLIGLSDQPRESARDAVALLKAQGIAHVVMLTGDTRETATDIATALGLDDHRAELLPEHKVSAVADLRRRYGSIAMVGDGINDAPALAAADVGFAMGVAGTDAALETADVALMADELLKIPYAMRLSRATLRNIKTNIAVSIALKAAFLALAVAGVATLWMAVVADTGASLLVIANALRLLRTD